MSGNSASVIRASLPCSVVLPAGCGKTHTIANLAKLVAEGGQRCLVLTHTHAGVDALKRKFKWSGVPSSSATIRTLDSWCVDLVKSFPQLAEMEIGDEPDWKMSEQYHAAGARAVRTAAIQRMLKVSYDVILVDEYQDCQIWQHELVLSIASHVPTCVLGDPLQGLFFFGSSSPVDWESDVLPNFPAVSIPVKAWRWKDANPALGEWLLQAREFLLNGEALDLTSAPIKTCVPANLIATCKKQPAHPKRVIVIGKWPQDCARLASRLGGNYTMMEELEGKFLLAFANAMDSFPPWGVAAEVRDFAAGCAYGVAEVFPSEARNRLSLNKMLKEDKFYDNLTQARALNVLLGDSSFANIEQALKSLAALPKFRLYRREAWNGVLEALRLAVVEPGSSLRDAVVKTRNQVRAVGRYPESRVLARPLLIKGLEFDHAVVTDPAAYNAHELYVCLTRGSASLTVATNEMVIKAVRPSL